MGGGRWEGEVGGGAGVGVGGEGRGEKWGLEAATARHWVVRARYYYLLLTTYYLLLLLLTTYRWGVHAPGRGGGAARRRWTR